MIWIFVFAMILCVIVFCAIKGAGLAGQKEQHEGAGLAGQKEQYEGSINFNFEGRQSKRFDDCIVWRDREIFIGGTQIGSYSYDTNGDIIVYSDVGTKIGKVFINDKLIVLNNTHTWQEWHQRYPLHCRDLTEEEYTMPVGYNTDFIRDYNDHTLIAKINGAPDVAAAAFVCAVYEEREDSKYHQFYHEWKK